MANATISCALEVVGRILHLAPEEWSWVERLLRIRMLQESKRRAHILTRDAAG